MANETSTLFPPDVCKWWGIAALYEQTAQEQLKLGNIITRKMFTDTGFFVVISPLAMADLLALEHPVGLVKQPVQSPPSIANGRMKWRG